MADRPPISRADRRGLAGGHRPRGATRRNLQTGDERSDRSRQVQGLCRLRDRGEETGRAGWRPQSRRIIWEPVNEPDISYKPIAGYYELYAHAFKALREAEPQAQICGPGFAFPSYDKYRAFLDYCRANHLECNYLAWHYTGWDPAAPEKQKWHLGRLRELQKEYKEQKIREIHCDEWGAGPDKPGRLQPGRAVVWFHYLENVYGVDRACRANWGRQDDYLGGIITSSGEPLPVYHAYRYYGSTKGQTARCQ